MLCSRLDESVGYTASRKRTLCGSALLRVEAVTFVASRLVNFSPTGTVMKPIQFAELMYLGFRDAVQPVVPMPSRSHIMDVAVTISAELRAVEITLEEQPPGERHAALSLR